MEFIREKIKEKPINKKRIAIKIGIAALCGLIFALVVCGVLIIAGPIIRGRWETDGSEHGTQTESEEESTSTEANQNVIVLPPDLNISISDYQTLQDELYEIGNGANKSIVTVLNMENENDWMENNFETEGQGAGIIVAEDSNYVYALTERKFIQDAPHIRVSFVDGTGASATLFKYDGNTGVAILTVEKRLLKPETKRAIAVATLGNSKEVSNGALVIALGCPLGTSYSVLTGNITSTENEVLTKDKNYSVFTTDIVASQNGSGVLVNTKGEIIGIMMQDFSGSQNMSTVTAVAVDEMKNIINSLKEGKDIPFVGIYIATVTDDISEDYDIPKGVYVKEVITDSPAMKAGLQSGDVITHINGEGITTDALFSEKISQLIPGTTCEITVKRQSGDKYYVVTCEVTIGVLP